MRSGVNPGFRRTGQSRRAIHSLDELRGQNVGSGMDGVREEIADEYAHGKAFEGEYDCWLEMDPSHLSLMWQRGRCRWDRMR